MGGLNSSDHLVRVLRSLQPNVVGGIGGGGRNWSAQLSPHDLATLMWSLSNLLAQRAPDGRASVETACAPATTASAEMCEDVARAIVQRLGESEERRAWQFSGSQAASLAWSFGAAVNAGVLKADRDRSVTFALDYLLQRVRRACEPVSVAECVSAAWGAAQLNMWSSSELELLFAYIVDRLDEDLSSAHADHTNTDLKTVLPLFELITVHAPRLVESISERPKVRSE